MSSTVFLREVDWDFVVSIFVPSHEYPVFIERESLEFPLFFDFDRFFHLIDRSSDIFSFFRYSDDTSIKKKEIFLSIPEKIFIFIHLKE